MATPDVQVASIDLFLNGAFFTGFALDSDRLIADGYAASQQRLIGQLGGTNAGWEYSSVSDRPWYSSLEVYPTLMPIGFITHGGNELTGRLKWSISSPAANPDFVCDVEKVTIDFFDFGVGVASVCLQIQFPTDVALGDDCRRRLDPLVDQVEELFNARDWKRGEITLTALCEAAAWTTPEQPEPEQTEPEVEQAEPKQAVTYTRPCGHFRTSSPAWSKDSTTATAPASAHSG